MGPAYVQSFPNLVGLLNFVVFNSEKQALEYHPGPLPEKLAGKIC